MPLPFRSKPHARRPGRAATLQLGAPEIAQAIRPDGDWHDLLAPIRRAAVALAQAGRLVIYRKGKPADPNDFRGVYRHRPAAAGLNVDGSWRRKQIALLRPLANRRSSRSIRARQRRCGQGR